MQENGQEWLEEEKRIRLVLKELDQKLHSLKGKTGGLKEDIIDLRKHFWSDVTVNIADENEAVETLSLSVLLRQRFQAGFKYRNAKSAICGFYKLTPHEQKPH